MQKYIGVASSFDIDCVLTLSNQLVVNPTHVPYADGRKGRKGRPKQLLHTSWANLLTTAQILRLTPGALTDDEMYLLDEVVHYMDEDGKQVTHFDRMKGGDSWGKLVDAAKGSGDWTQASSPDHIDQAIGNWHEAERHLSLKLSKQIGERVLVKNFKKSLDQRVDETKARLTEQRELSCTLAVDHGPGNIEVVANLATCVLSVSTTVKAPDPLDNDTPSRRIRWLTDQLSDKRREKKHSLSGTERLEFSKEDIVVRARYDRKRQSRAQLHDAVRDWKCLKLEEGGAKPVNFEIEMGRDLGRGTFKGASKFPQALEALVLAYYNGVYQHIDKWEEGTPRVRRLETVPAEQRPRPSAVPAPASDGVASPSSSVSPSPTTVSESAQEDLQKPDTEGS